MSTAQNAVLQAKANLEIAEAEAGRELQAKKQAQLRQQRAARRA